MILDSHKMVQSFGKFSILLFPWFHSDPWICIENIWLDPLVLLRKQRLDYQSSRFFVNWKVYFIKKMKFIYTIFFLGWNHYVDKFFNLYNVAFAMIILPAFYVSADSNFRTHLAKYGIFSAVKYVLKNWNTFTCTLWSLKFSKIWRCNIFFP